ncbi:MAG: DUF6057 family protein [Prevotellaceae bacterium]|nr:DUF6057 family protein [Prevotellaceae bacterium]
MNKRNNYLDGSTLLMRVVCAVIFILFSVLYLWRFQANTLAFSQHVLSRGATHYQPVVGTVVITIVLLLVATAMQRLSRLWRNFHWLVYMPSMLLLVMLTDVSADMDLHFSLLKWCWIIPLVMTLWGVGVFFARNIQEIEDHGHVGLFERPMWINLLCMCLMMIGVGLAGNGNSIFHYTMEIETNIQHGRYDEAMRVGRRNPHADANLTMLRTYALAHQGQLGERIFTYPVKATSSDLVPVTGQTRCRMMPTDSIYRLLGAKPLKGMTTEAYLRALLITGQATPAVADYILTGYLIDRKIDAFAKELPKHYAINDSLPRHYREALVLYNHIRSNPVVVYHNSVMDTDFEDMQKLEARFEKRSAKNINVYDNYAGTYWWYYEYGHGTKQ